MKNTVRDLQNVNSTTIRMWIGRLMLVLFVSSLLIYILTLESLPEKARIHSGIDSGLYYRIAAEIAPSITERSSVPVEVIQSNGSVANITALEQGEAEFAIVQGTVDFSQFSIVTPLYPDVMLVIVRKDSEIRNIRDLTGQAISLGPEGSGMRQSATKLLEHYGVPIEALTQTDKYFDQLVSDDTLQGAIVTTGIENQDLAAILNTGKFELLPIEDARAIELKTPFLKMMEIPQGLYGMNGDVPPKDIPVLATTAFVVTSQDMADELVQAVIKSIHEENLRVKFPGVLRREEVTEWVSSSMHPAALSYFYPADNIGMIKETIGSLHALKELILAMFALCYLIWTYWRKLMAREAQARLEKQRAILDRFMESTFKVETGQTGCYDVTQLRDSLFRITTIRLRALRQFTDHEIRSDQRFSIFMTQCGDLINKIQLKIVSQLASAESLESIDREQNMTASTVSEEAVKQPESEKPKTKAEKKTKKKDTKKK
tara:strand:- start:3531 stop:4994 length:1464 start_codon:yes stop_codon:yes gene_type:complete